MTPQEKKLLFKTAFGNLQAHDAVLREMENVDLQFELILSSSCFAQLKRHRMSTIIAQDYCPQLGVTVPPSIKAIGQQKDFMEIMRHTQNTYEQIQEKSAHCRRLCFDQRPPQTGADEIQCPRNVPSGAFALRSACPVGYSRPYRKNA